MTRPESLAHAIGHPPRSGRGAPVPVTPPRCEAPGPCPGAVAGAVVDPLARALAHYCAPHLDQVKPAPGQKITRHRPKENPTP